MLKPSVAKYRCWFSGGTDDEGDDVEAVSSARAAEHYALKYDEEMSHGNTVDVHVRSVDDGEKAPIKTYRVTTNIEVKYVARDVTREGR